MECCEAHHYVILLQFLHIFLFSWNRGLVIARLFRYSEVLKMGFRLLLGVRSSRCLSGLHLYGNVQIYRVGECFGAFAKLRKATIRFAMSVRPSICSHGTTRLPLDGVSWNVTFEYFSKNCRQNSRFIKIGQEERVLYLKTNIYFWSYIAQFFLECFVFNNFFLRKSCLFLDNFDNMAGQVRPQTKILRIRIAFSIPKATKTRTHAV